MCAYLLVCVVDVTDVPVAVDVVADVVVVTDVCVVVVLLNVTV